MTLQELKEITEIPAQKMKMPTAKTLRETGRIVAERQLENDTWIRAYQNGYALYHACGHSTVFQIHTCGAYLYVSDGISSYIPEHFFEKEPWYVRLLLEGEDRLYRNQQAKEQERTVSYSIVSEEWEVLSTMGDNPLEYLVSREVYLEWYRSERRERYQRERDWKHGVCSLEKLHEKGYYPEQSACAGDTTEETVLRNEYRDKLIDVLQNLPKQDARLVRLLYFEEVTVKEAAEILGCSRKTVGKRRERILKELRQRV